MANELKPWKYDIQYGPEGEANYAWVYDDHGVMVATMKSHKAKEIVERMNTRPAAPVEGLERYAPRPCDEMQENIGMDRHKYGEYVRFDQAEAIIAAERTEKEKIEDAWLESLVSISELKADNLALTARIKELETSLTVSRATVSRGNAWIKTLEAKLAAAMKILNDIKDGPKIECIPDNEIQEGIRNILEDKS